MSTAARFFAARDIRLIDEPDPRVADGHSLVEVSAVGLCGSDLHWYDEGGIGDATITTPLVGGHEMAGVVRGGRLDGRRVAVDPSVPCLRCDLCRRGHHNLCRDVVFAGHSTCDGGLQQLLSWPTELLHPLPEAMTAVEGAMLEPLGVAIHAVDLGHVPLASTAAVIGAGPIGLCLLQLLRVAGAVDVLVTDPLAHRREAATRLGAGLVLDPDDDTYGARLQAFTGGAGVDVAFEVAGTDAAIAAAVDVVRPGGRVVLAGIPSSDLSSFPAATARRKGLTFVMVRRMKDVYPRAIELVSSRRVDVASVVSHRFALAQVEEAFVTAVARRGLKVVVEPNAGG